MTTKIISTVYSGGYQLSAPVTTLSITASGYVAEGLTTAGASAYTIVNDGGVAGADYGVDFLGAADLTNAGGIFASAGPGVTSAMGGTVANNAGADISGSSGVALYGAAGSVSNAGSIVGTLKYGVDLAAGGSVSNAAGATIKGVKGVIGGGPLTLSNAGLVIGTGTVGVGVYLGAGGEVINAAGGAIRGYGLSVGGYNVAASLINYGIVYSPHTAVYLKDGGAVINGSLSDLSANITGRVAVGLSGAGETVLNFGTIQGHLGGTQAGVGVVLLDGGDVINGASGDHTALIAANVGVVIGNALGTVSNFGDIGGPTIVSVLAVGMTGGGTVTNGSATDTTALISGYAGVATTTITATVRNFATILGGGGEALPRYGDAGVYMTGGGSLINGATNDTRATISGYDGVYTKYDALTVTNFGTVSGSVSGVFLTVGGRITNGSAADTGARIDGRSFGVEATGAAATISNFATILGATAAPDYGVYLAMGVLTNGSASDSAALIQASSGLELGASARATNFGVIRGVTSSPQLGFPPAGVVLRAGASLTNETGALIVGDAGVESDGGATISNFGTIDGVNGIAAFLAAGDRLNAEAGSQIIGAVDAGAALVDVVGGAVSLTALLSAGIVEGAGTLALAGGASTFSAGANLMVDEISVSGVTTTVEVAADVSEVKLWRQSAGTLTVDAGDQMTFKGAGDSFSGTLAGAGEIEFAAGSDTITNATLSARIQVSGATVALSGAIALSGTMIVSGPDLDIAAAGATLSGAGELALSPGDTGEIEDGALTNAAKIVGAGEIAVSGLTNSGAIEANTADALILKTGAATVINSGLIYSSSTGGLTIDGAVSNTGTLEATKGTLTVDGSVSGVGKVLINGGTVDLAGAFSGAVSYTATGGVLVLAHSKTDTVTITGFPKTNIGTIDLQDIKFSGATETFSGTTTSGTLTVKNGANIATITLEGNYTTSTFTLSADSSGGTIVTDPVKTVAGPPPLQPLVSAIAGFGGSGGGSTHAILNAPGRTAPLLASAA